MASRQAHARERDAARLTPLAALLVAGCAGAPSPMLPASEVAGELATLGWWLLAIASAVVVGMTVLVLVPLRWRAESLEETPVSRRGGPRGIAVGVGVTALVLAGIFLSTLVTLNDTAEPPREPDVTIEIVGHQWWWEVRYLGPDSSVVATTANEFHVPVGEPVRLIVGSADVIHSLWVPRLHGKIDLIPGRSNHFWLQADRPGRYRGQCAEYCGMQHAHMELYVEAVPPPDFRAWLERVSGPAPEPEDPLARRGRAVFMNRECVTCHTIRGTDARGERGPDLTHFASRETLAAGMYPNDRAHLTSWVVDATGLKPGARMPEMALEPEALHAVVAYLQSLR